MKSHFRYILVFVLVGTMLGACDEQIKLDIDQAPSLVVIEALVSTDNTNHFVKITKSKDFYAAGETNRITNALVQVADDAGNAYTYSHNPENIDELNGYYFADASFAGVPGRTYTLTVQAEGTTYQATDELRAVGTIDSLTYELSEDANNGDFELDVPGPYYAVFFNAKEPKNTVDYYLFKFYRNGERVLDFGTDVYFSDDELLGEEIDNLEIASYYAETDTVTVEMYSLSRESFLFYQDLSAVLNNDGGMFSPIPANPRSNLTNGALGFFQASAIDRASIIIGK